MNIFVKVFKFISKPHFFPLLIVFFFGLLASKGLIGEGYFNMHDDLQIMRQLEMEKCFLDMQIPCRWVPDMGYGYGYPLFNFYPPLPYLTGEIFRLIGYSFIDTVKIVFALAFILSGITMYFLAKEFFGKVGGIVSAVFYLWAPYHAVDIYVRGAMNEAWAMIWFPLIFFASYRLIKSSANTKQWIMLLALAWFGLFTSHNLMVLIFAPIFAVWNLFWLAVTKNYKSFVSLVVAGIWGFLLAAFFTLPVFLEKGIVQTDSLVVGYYEYTAHFATIKQLLFTRFWGYGPSVWMDQSDGMSFQVGTIHWVLSLVILLIVGVKIIKSKKISPVYFVTLFMIAVGWFAAFMAHSRSTPVWMLVNELKFVQFPWRFLTLVVFSFSMVSGGIVKLLPKALSYSVSFFLCLAVIIYSWNFFTPEHGKLGPLTDEKKLTGAAWELQQTAGIYDYLPNTAWTAPKAPRKELAEIMEGEGVVKDVKEGTDWATFSVEVVSDTSLIRVNTLAFPDWTFVVDGKKVPYSVPKTEEWGRMYIQLPKGINNVSMNLNNTPVRKVGNILSLVAWSAFLYAGIKYVKGREASN